MDGGFLKWASVLILINWYQTNGLCSIEIKKMSRSEIEMKNDIEVRYKACTSVRSKDPRTRFHGLPVCTSSDQSDREEETARRRVTLHSRVEGGRGVHAHHVPFSYTLPFKEPSSASPFTSFVLWLLLFVLPFVLPRIPTWLRFPPC